MVLIDFIEARAILNSRGEQTVEATVHLTDGTAHTASTPSGKSRSSHEAVELIDKEMHIYFGHSVHHAVSNVTDIIAPRLKKLDPMEQSKIDQILIELDGTPNKAHLGANATLAVSMAVARAAAHAKGVELYKHINDLFLKVEAKNKYEEVIKLSETTAKPRLPIPAFNVMNGGMHADSGVSIQEFLIVPAGIPKLADKIRAGAEVSFEIKKLLNERGLAANIGDEGGYAASFDDPFQVIDLIVEAVKRTGYNVHNQILYGFDIAGTHEDKPLPENFFDTIMGKYPIVSIEDPFGEEDFTDFATLNTAYPNVFITADDLTSMMLDRLYQAIETASIDCVIIKPNQVGTITESLIFAKVAKDAGIELFASHRSGETNDTFIADMAVGIGAEFIKAGNVMRGERVAKYNRLQEIAPKFED